jgi:hypothetical protein
MAAMSQPSVQSLTAQSASAQSASAQSSTAQSSIAQFSIVHSPSSAPARPPQPEPTPAEVPRAPPSPTPYLLPSSLPLILGFALGVIPALVAAQTGNTDAGSTLWTAFRGVLYGPWGLVGSAVVVAIGIYMFLERGFMHALGVMAAGALIFFVPLIVISMRNTAQALGGAG